MVSTILRRQLYDRINATANRTQTNNLLSLLRLTTIEFNILQYKGITMAEITSISVHRRTRQGSVNALNNHQGNTTLGHSQYSIAFGKGSNRKSKTMHCSKETAQKEVAALTSQGL